MAHNTYLLLALLVACTPTQRTVLTETQHAPGQRALHLSGLFQDADSVYVQVYSDGQPVGEDVFVGTFQLTLSAYDDYVIVFTDARGRVKRVSIHELSDDLIEFYPPLEIDFGRTGNLVLIKQSTGKPDFQEIDVGMSRQHRTDAPR